VGAASPIFQLPAVESLRLKLPVGSMCSAVKVGTAHSMKTNRMIQHTTPGKPWRRCRQLVMASGRLPWMDAAMSSVEGRLPVAPSAISPKSLHPRSYRLAQEGMRPLESEQPIQASAPHNQSNSPPLL